MRILAADDDPVYQVLLRDLLTQWEYDVTVVSDGADAWEVLQSEGAPRLVLLDWLMPGFDGFELCRMIRQDPSGEGVYIILLTGSRQKGEIMRVLVAGADDYLIKPFDPLDLKIRLRAAQRILDLRELIKNKMHVST
ncbi:unnamed protein product [marine sediment metagenome]|uniref:Response regulatory domain-containing protein n=1 Tax=marine sediment metagenome TaxID=412755 RepID=X0T5T7_9ZZZZ